MPQAGSTTPAPFRFTHTWRNLNAQPAGPHQGTLFVNEDSSVWLDEIVRYRRKDILTRLQTALGRELVKRSSFRAG